jgi:hypothetical protein
MSSIAQAQVPSSIADAKRRERIFYSGMSIAIAATVFVGFSRTWFLRPYFAQVQPLIPLLVVHGIIFSSWIVLFMTQTSLVAAKRTRTHMRLGVAGGVLACLIPIVGIVTAIIRSRVPSAAQATDALRFLIIPFGDMLVFSILIGSAFYFRYKVGVHKRLMLLGTLALLPAAISRIPFAFIEQNGVIAFYGLSDLFIVPCLIFDILTRGRPHRATMLGALLLVLTQPLRIIIGMTNAWLVFAGWLQRLI